tara:strand:+ start:846 stop:1040 length:195 start_codon:yes stop_codon:yes gene_type:complete
VTQSNLRTDRQYARLVFEFERRATELWGKTTARRARESIESVAANVGRLVNDLPDFEEEPGFYL